MFVSFTFKDFYIKYNLNPKVQFAFVNTNEEIE